jgi:hypothetical protein
MTVPTLPPMIPTCINGTVQGIVRLPDATWALLVVADQVGSPIVVPINAGLSNQIQKATG